MSFRLLWVGVLLGVFATGCSSLARGGAAQVASSPSAADDDDEDLGPVPVTSMAPQAGPGQTEVAWEDNGIPIRQLTGPGKPYEMKVPDSKPKKLPSAKK